MAAFENGGGVFLESHFSAVFSAPRSVFQKLSNNKKVVNVVDAGGSPLIGHGGSRLKVVSLKTLQHDRSLRKKFYDVSRIESHQVRLDFLFGLGRVVHGVNQFAGRLGLRCLHLILLGDGLIDRLHGVMVLNNH